MKAIIQSYTPQECEKIINGQQTIKVCITRPPHGWQYVEE